MRPIDRLFARKPTNISYLIIVDGQRTSAQEASARSLEISLPKKCCCSVVTRHCHPSPPVGPSSSGPTRRAEYSRGTSLWLVQVPMDFWISPVVGIPLCGLRMASVCVCLWPTFLGSVVNPPNLPNGALNLALTYTSQAASSWNMGAFGLVKAIEYICDCYRSQQ